MLCADFRTSKHQLIKEFVTFFRACLWRTPACVWWRKREGFASDDEVDRLPDSRAVSVNFYTSNAQSLKLALNFSSTWRSDPETSSRLMNRPPDHWSGEKIDKTSLFKTNWNDEEKKKIFWRFPRKRQRHKKRDHLKIDEREIFCLINFCSLSIGGEHKKFKSFSNSRYSFLTLFCARDDKNRTEMFIGSMSKGVKCAEPGMRTIGMIENLFSRCGKQRLFRDGLSRARRQLSSEWRNSRN